MQAKTLLAVIFGLIVIVAGRARTDNCSKKPTINGICLTTTLGIYYDAETQHCRYMGCSPEKKLFATLEDCEKICNNRRHTILRQKNANKN